MDKYVYPAVFYFDSESKTYCAAIDDLAIYVDGNTIEEAHKNASIVLGMYIRTVLKYDDELTEPSSFDDLVVKHPKNIVMLVEYNHK